MGGAGAVALGTVPAGHDAPGEFPAGVAGAGVELLEFEPGELALDAGAAGCMVPFAGTQVTAPELLGADGGGVPAGALPVSGFVLGIGAGGALWVFGPAAFVVIGVGGPMVVGGTVVFELAGAVAAGGGAAFGTDVCGGGTALGAGAVR